MPGGTPEMIRQYGPQRHRVERIGDRALPVGTIPVGSLFRYQPPRARRPMTYMVEAWLPRVCARAGRAGFGALARGGHLAQVRVMATGRAAQLSDALIRRAMEARDASPSRHPSSVQSLPTQDPRRPRRHGPRTAPDGDRTGFLASGLDRATFDRLQVGFHAVQGLQWACHDAPPKRAFWVCDAVQRARQLDINLT